MVPKAAKFIFLSAIFAAGASSSEQGRTLHRFPRQAHGKNGQQDQSSAETGFLGGGGVENSKYFQRSELYRTTEEDRPHNPLYRHHCTPQDIAPTARTQLTKSESFGVTNPTMNFDPLRNRKTIDGGLTYPNVYQHLPEHDKYEFGHRRGNDHHVIERYEKAIPHEGQFKTKVRWADKKGGHGEHYWDYNHAGHGGHGGQGDGDKNGGYSDQVPVYAPIHKAHQKRQSEKVSLEDVESDSQPSRERAFVEELEKEIGGVEKVDILREGKQKRNSGEGAPSLPEDPQLVFDVKSGKVVDELTGKKYILQPVN